MEIWRWPSRDILAEAPEGWGVLQLYMLGDRANELYSHPPSTWVPWAPGIFNTGAYIINRRGMQRVSSPDPAMLSCCVSGGLPVSSCLLQAWTQAAGCSRHHVVVQKRPGHTSSRWTPSPAPCLSNHSDNCAYRPSSVMRHPLMVELCRSWRPTCLGRWLPTLCCQLAWMPAQLRGRTVWQTGWCTVRQGPGRQPPSTLSSRGETSDIVPEHLGVHHATKAVVTKLMADSGPGHRTHLGVRRH